MGKLRDGFYRFKTTKELIATGWEQTRLGYRRGDGYGITIEMIDMYPGRRILVKDSKTREHWIITPAMVVQEYEEVINLINKYEEA